MGATPVRDGTAGLCATNPIRPQIPDRGRRSWRKQYLGAPGYDPSRSARLSGTHDCHSDGTLRWQVAILPLPAPVPSGPCFESVQRVRHYCQEAFACGRLLLRCGSLCAPSTRWCGRRSCCSTTLSSSSEGRKQPKNPLMCVLETTRFKASGASKRSLSSLKRWSRRNSAARNLLSCKWPITKSGQDGSSQLDSLHTAQATS